MKINNKGFTLIELLASIVILSILIAIMVPSVNYLIEKNKNDNYDNLKKSIISAAKVYISDNRYNITLDLGEDSKLCLDSTVEEDISSIGENNLKNLLGVNKVPISLLVDSKTLSTNSEGNILNPKDKNKILDKNNSYVLIKYQCSTKDYNYAIDEGEEGTPAYKEYLVWE